MKPRLYRIDELKLAEKANAGGQAALIIKAMSDAPNGITIRDIVAKINGQLQTRQDPMRVVNFYISTWHKAGLVTRIESEELPGGELGAVNNEPAAAPQPSGPDIKEMTLVDAVQHIVDLDGASTPLEIKERFAMLGRSAEIKNIQDACRRLVNKGVFVRGDGGVFDFAPEHQEETETANA